MLNPRVDVYTEIDGTSEYTLDMVSTDKIEVVVDNFLHLAFTRDGLLRLTRITDNAVTQLGNAVFQREETPDASGRALDPNGAPVN
ncbi:hypothetical protein [Actinokineospora inagensis]|uniref:hypothetical protein n=1 Tax=Actinokineospora inagensis TaxID=103730 RepID=UPI000403D900|nr:hypothetical protein [Actinokineospora inagensis]